MINSNKRWKEDDTKIGFKCLVHSHRQRQKYRYRHISFADTFDERMRKPGEIFPHFIYLNRKHRIAFSIVSLIQTTAESFRFGSDYWLSFTRNHNAIVLISLTDSNSIVFIIVTLSACTLLVTFRWSTLNMQPKKKIKPKSRKNGKVDKMKRKTNLLAQTQDEKKTILEEKKRTQFK